MARVLVVDDDAGVRRVVSEIVSSLGHVVEEAENGRVALNRFREAPYELVITDINMPVLDGIEVITTLKRGDRPVPIIAMSGGGKLSAELLLESAHVLGAVSAIAKPFTVTELAEEIATALDARPQKG